MNASEAPQLFGVHKLYCSEEEPEVDIVAVHGLNGDALGTWKSDKGDVCWLKHPSLLPKYVKRCRVLTWGYNANVASYGSRTTSSDRILQHAHTLVAQLQADRELEGAGSRPIIFICHSLGGIVVKRALAYSQGQTSAMSEHLHSIFVCTYAVMFFGTPHHGTSKAQLLRAMPKFASTSTRAGPAFLPADSNLVKALEEECETLQNITDQFAPLMKHFRIFFFWEQHRTDFRDTATGSSTEDYVVSESSAAPILDNTERCGIAADHRGMCKFENGKEAGFRTIVAALRRYCEDAPGAVEKRTERANELLQNQRWNEATELVRNIPEPRPVMVPAPAAERSASPVTVADGDGDGEGDNSIAPTSMTSMTRAIANRRAVRGRGGSNSATGNVGPYQVINPSQVRVRSGS